MDDHTKDSKKNKNKIPNPPITSSNFRLLITGINPLLMATQQGNIYEVNPGPKIVDLRLDPGLTECKALQPMALPYVSNSSHIIQRRGIGPGLVCPGVWIKSVDNFPSLGMVPQKSSIGNCDFRHEDVDFVGTLSFLGRGRGS
jgi:hypothetical protein